MQPRAPTRVLVAMRPARAACCSAHREGVVRCRPRREWTSGFEQCWHSSPVVVEGSSDKVAPS